LIDLNFEFIEIGVFNRLNLGFKLRPLFEPDKLIRKSTFILFQSQFGLLSTSRWSNS